MLKVFKVTQINSITEVLYYVKTIYNVCIYIYISFYVSIMYI